MKTTGRLLAVLFAATSTLAAQDEAPETLFSGDIDHGGYGGPVIKARSLLGDPAILVGGYGGWFINHTLMIGGGGFGLVNNMAAPAEAGLIDSLRPSIGFGYGGLMLEYTGNSNSLVHYTIHTLVGAGGAGYYLRHNSWDIDNDFDDDDDDDRNEWEACFTAEIGVGVELNVASFFRVNLGGTYLFVNGVELPGLSDSDLSGPSAYLALKFGKF